MIAMGRRARRRRPRHNGWYRGDDVHDHSRNPYSTVNTSTEAISNILNAIGHLA
jgi:chloramphenicol 3-O-phosphotransferase